MGVRHGYKQTEAGVIPQDWTLKPISDIATTVASGRSSVDSEFGEFPVYGSTGPIGRSAKADYAGSAILIARVGANAGTLNVVEGEYGVTDNTIILRVNDSVVSSYVWRQLAAKRLNSMVFGSGQPLITGTQIKSLLIPFPSSPDEQAAIAQALSDADALIESLEQLVAKKRQIKQGAMQELLTGKKRLSGFSGEWEVKRFCDIADKTMPWSIGGGPFGSNLKASDYVPEGVRIIQLQNIGDGRFHDDYAIYTSEEKADELLSNNIFPGEIILSKMGDPVARCCFVPSADRRYLMASDGIRLAVDPGRFDKRFVHDYINSVYFRKKAIEASTGSTRQRIGLTDLKQLPFVAPPLPEQTAIAAILSDMDVEISSLEAQLAKAHNLKQGMMQELLTGRIRLA